VLPVLVIGSSVIVLIALAAAGRGAAPSQSPAGLRRSQAGHSDAWAEAAPVVRGPVWRIALGLLAFVLLLNVAGFIAAGTVLFACTASAFGSHRWARDSLIGLTLCAAVYVTFTFGLGVVLP
jgi:hypothetical protein